MAPGRTYSLYGYRASTVVGCSISPLSTDLGAGWTNNVRTVDLLQVMWRNGY